MALTPEEGESFTVLDKEARSSVPDGLIEILVVEVLVPPPVIEVRSGLEALVIGELPSGC